MKNSLQLKVKDKIEAGKNIKVARFKKEIRKTNPHKHNSYFEIIYLSKGTGLHAIDTHEYPVIPPVIFNVRKEQVHHWDLAEEPEGYVLILKKDFLENSVDKELKKLLSDVSAFPCISLEDCKAVEVLFELLLEEYKPEQDNNTPAIEGLLKALLAKVLQLAKPLGVLQSTKTNLCEQFKDILNQEKISFNTVAYYAEKLNTTPQNLNSVCRKSADQSASDVIAEYIINESKRLLIYSELNVSEISVALGFKDNSHFVKYFKRYTGHTPNSFRQF